MTREAPSIDLGAHERGVQSTQSAQRALADDARDVMKERLGLPEVSTTVGDHQRHQLRVPTRAAQEGTVISAGRRQDGRNYDGYGLTTNSHVAVSAEGGKEESTMTLQANGQLLVQSDDDSVYVVSKAPAVIASAAVTNVAATGGVVIAAGGSRDVANQRIEGQKPTIIPAALAEHAELMGTANDDWSSWSDAVKDAVTARDELSDTADPDHKTEWAGNQDEVKSSDLASATLDSRNQLGDATTSLEGGVAIYGDGGFVVGSPEFGAIHAEKGLSLSSTKPSITATEHLDLSAAEDASLTAGNHVAIIGAQRVRLIANEDDLTIAARAGDKVEVMAKAVHLGELEPDDPQEETETVSLRAKKRISLGTDKDASRDEGDEGIWMQTHEVIDGLADSTIQLAAGETVTLKIDDDTEYSIVVDSEGTITITSDQTTFTISDSDGLVFGDSQDDYLTASSDGVFAGIDSDNCIDISSSEVSIKGSKIEIG
ncbi:MAG: hypothetical protein KC619_36095 [Myxococcales bacterium]|nr:hypothetical protein [Myxococcales bacterium]